MNIFVLDKDPIVSAKMYCDKHLPKMVVELYQQLGSSVIRHGATPEQMPLTKKGTPLKGGYHNHPATRFCGDSRDNFIWACYHAAALAEEYTKRFNKTHFCADGIEILSNMAHLIPEGPLTPFAQCMPDEFKDADVVKAYRAYYHSKTFAKWERGRPAPSWWKGAIV
tara:strand:+ start:7755 stop:8255 length:501 start_codon:yes stop_codon:yes gene_type:complete